jgi:outer membrane protein
VLVLTPSSALLWLALAPAPLAPFGAAPPAAAPEPAAAPTSPATPAGEPGPGLDAPPAELGTTFEAPEVPMRGLSPDYTPPFDSDELELSDVLKRSMEQNLDLAGNAIDVQISEQQVKAALGAFDVFLNAGLTGTAAETPQRGSQFAISTASRSISGNIGIQRRFETGGQLNFDVTATRGKTTQLINPFDASLGSVDLSNYQIQPRLSITHPLLRGAGLKFNRADYDRAKIAVSQAEATRQVTAQTVVSNLVSSYWDLLFAHRDLENKRRSVEVAKKQLERTEALVAAGRVSPVDAKAVEQALAAREGEVIVAENTLLGASLDLRALMGEDFTKASTLGVLPATDPIVRPRLVDTQAEVDRALSANPQVRQLQLGIASRRVDELVAANAKLPQLDVSGSFVPQGRSVDSNPDPSTGDPGRQGSWSEAFRNIFSDNVADDGLLADWTVSGSITLQWDIQNRAPKANYEIARLQIAKAEQQLDVVRQQIAGNVIRASNSVRTAAKSMEVAEVSLELAKENLAAEQARFDVGRSTNFDVLQRLDEVDAAESGALNAQIGYLKALNQLQALNGEILPAYGIDVR